MLSFATRLAVRIAVGLGLAAGMAGTAGAWQIGNWFGRSVVTDAGAYSMGLVVDGEFVRRARDVVLAGMRETTFVDLGRDQAARALLRRDARSSLADGMRSYDFHLTGAAEALARLDQCVSAGGRGRWTKSEFGGRLPPVLHCCQEGPIGRWPI